MAEQLRPFLIMAGGTGGHIFPGLAVARALQSRGFAVAWMGSKQSMEADKIPAQKIDFHGLDVVGFRGKGLLALLKAPFLLLRSVSQASRVMRQLKPQAVLSFGGFAAGPGGLAARLNGAPLFVHEQNRIAGLTNRVLSKLAKRTWVGFDDALPKAVAVGNPVRTEIAQIKSPEQRFAGREGPLRLLVLGGSLGSLALNRHVPEALAQLKTQGFSLEVRHQCGARWLQQTQERYQQQTVTADVSAFISDMAEAYSWADVVIARAGALTIAELVSAGLHAILVPFPHAVDDHQTANARWLAERGAAEVLPESEKLATELSASLIALNRAQLLQHALRNRALAKPDCAEQIASQTLSLIGLNSSKAAA